MERGCQQNDSLVRSYTAWAAALTCRYAAKLSGCSKSANDHSPPLLSRVSSPWAHRYIAAETGCPQPASAAAAGRTSCREQTASRAQRR